MSPPKILLLFNTGIIDGINFKFFIKSLKRSKRLLILFIIHLIVMIGVLGGWAIAISRLEPVIEKSVGKLSRIGLIDVLNFEIL
jgi:hypothetical protein